MTARTPAPGWVKIRPIVAWYDLWIGAFWDAGKRRLYLLPVPCIGLVFEFSKRTEPHDDD